MAYNKQKLHVWQIAREYALIAEAGGVKNVVASLSTALVNEGMRVTVFLPLYGCTNLNGLNFTEHFETKTQIVCDAKSYDVTFCTGCKDGVDFVFVKASIFSNKRDVYVYTEEDEKENPLHKKGTGHVDANVMNVVFQKAVIAYARIFSTKREVQPDIVHCQDAHTALIPAFAFVSPQYAKMFCNTRFFVTIHNAGDGYRQTFSSVDEAYRLTELPHALLKTGLAGNLVEPFLIASSYATLSTVSPWYADELLSGKDEYASSFSKALAEKRIAIPGITNGIDCNLYNPELDSSLLPYKFSPQNADLAGKYELRAHLLKTLCKDAKNGANTLADGLVQYGHFTQDGEDLVYISYHGRLVHQKGVSVLIDAIPLVLQKHANARFIINGQGDSALEEACKKLAEQNDGLVVYVKGYEKVFARECVALSDFLALPSFFEPCGLEDFIGSLFGTVPIAHAVGGLQKIKHGKTGFLYKNNTAQNLASAISDAINLKKSNPSAILDIIKNASKTVQQDFCWRTIIKAQYLPIYEGKNTRP